ncbi:hypothetical protein [Levilactobacillus brevis]|uniref:hypothetical protein n=1 Tax=Levilactobacillus brevis TaxID=1580 RepID=UPI0020CB9764|nr:hypothetical protein [Levilactobacillus brevis]MCP9615575.1 hypothetical protein [Levilactobacillus brevis]
MSKWIKEFVVGLGVCIGLSLFGVPSTAHAKYVGHYSTPTEIRGTWYQYRGKNKFNVIKISKHSFYYKGKLLYSSKKSGANKLYVEADKSSSNSVYLLNGHYKYEYQTFGSFWLSKSKVAGHRVLKNYHQMGQYNVFTRNKVKHNYSYEKNSLKDIGK